MLFYLDRTRALLSGQLEPVLLDQVERLGHRVRVGFERFVQRIIQDGAGNMQLEFELKSEISKTPNELAQKTPPAKRSELKQQVSIKEKAFD